MILHRPIRRLVLKKLTYPLALFQAIFLALGCSHASAQMKDIADVVAYLLVESCLEAAGSRLRCPPRENFEALQTAALEDDSFKEAIATYLQEKSLKEHLDLINEEMFDREVMHHSPDLDTALMPVTTLTQGARSPNYYSIEFLLASSIRGINSLNLGPSTLHSLRVTRGAIELLEAFTLDGRPLFESMVNRARAAEEVWNQGADPAFLLEREEWLFQGAMITWQAGDQNLIDAYYELLKLQSTDASSF